MSKKLAILVLLLLISLVSVPCRSATPAETIQIDGFKVVLSEPDIEFPDSITFDIEAEGEADISEIVLHYQVDRLSVVPVTSLAFPHFETGTKVKTSWKWDMRKTGALPPGTELRYWWSIEDAEGNHAETDVASFSFDDHHHSWQSLISNNISLFWYQGGNSFGEELLTAAEESLDRIAEDTGAQLEEQTRLYVYAGSSDLRDALVYPQDWTGGVAYTEYGTIAIGISNEILDWGKGAIAHELAHLVVHQAIYSGYGTQLPTWLDEGLAMHAQGKLASDMQHVLDIAIEQNLLFSVKSLSGSFPVQTEAAYLAYAQSYSLIHFLLEEEQGGRARMMELLNAFKQGSGYVEALQQVYGLGVDQLDELWRQEVRSPSDYVYLSFVE